MSKKALSTMFLIVLTLTGSISGFAVEVPEKNSNHIPASLTGSDISRTEQNADLYLVQAQHAMMAFSAMFELQNRGVDYQKCRQTLSQATASLKNAKYAYIALLSKGNSIESNTETANRLSLIDWDSFCEQHDLNKTIYNKVRQHLETGDTQALHRQLLKAVTDCERILKQMERTLSQNKLPEVALVWKANEILADTHLSAQYAARLLMSVK